MVADRRHFIGLDLGQTTDFTALAILERPTVPPGSPRELRRPAYALRHLKRYPLGTPYPQVVQAVVKLIQTPPMPGSVLAVDQTGVGRAVVDMFADGLRGKATCRMFPITITNGHRSNMEKDGFHVPKRELVARLQVLLQSRRLQISRLMLEADTLVREMENFRVKITKARNEVFEAWRAGQHDDLVLAVALAAWLGEKGLPPLVDPPPVSNQDVSVATTLDSGPSCDAAHADSGSACLGSNPSSPVISSEHRCLRSIGMQSANMYACEPSLSASEGRRWRRFAGCKPAFALGVH